MTIEVPPNMIARVEAFVAEVVGDETDPVQIEACRKIALVTLIQRGLYLAGDMKRKDGRR